MRLNAILACCLSFLAMTALAGCDTIDKARMRLFGVRVCAPEDETAEWVIAQALHAASIAIDHPASGERLTFSAPLPSDMERMLAALRSVGKA